MASDPPSPSDGTSAEYVVTRGGFRLLRRTQTVRRTVEEVYLRDDIACGSAMCSACAHLESDPGHPPPLRADATHYAVPDARALAENVDAFLAAAVPGAGDVVLLASELRKAHARGDARLSRALRAFTADPRHARGVKLFPNEHFRATSTAVGEHHAMHPRKRNAVIAARDGTAFAALPASAAGVAARAHAVLRAAGWYAAHVASARGVPMVVVTDDEALLELPPDAAPPGVVLSPPREYFAAFRPGSRALAEFERVEARRRDAEEAERAWHVDAATNKKHYPNHLSPREAAEGLRFGTLVRGILRVRADAPDLAVVAATSGAGGSVEPNGGGVPARIDSDGARSADADDGEDDEEASRYMHDEASSDASSLDENDASFFSFRFGGGDVLIPGRRARNRAFDGDEVAIRIFPPERWTRGPEVVAARAGRRDDEEDEEEDDADEDDDSSDATDSSETTVPTGEVVAILRPRGADFVATVCAEDAEELARSAAGDRASSRAAARVSVLAIPADRRLPKVRLMTRRASELVRQRLLVRVERWPNESRHPEARVLRVLGPAGDAATETAALLLEHEILDAPFSRGALAELPSAGAAWRVPRSELSARVDAREWRVMSIDPPGCVDVDDAIGVRRMSSSGADGEKDALEISVHIADVGYFVAENSLLDVEARARGTTTYLVDKRLDMLPELLSADLASLVAGKERLAMFCAFSLDPETFATRRPPRFGRSVIRSRHQLDYYHAQAIFERRTPPPVNDTPSMSREETEAVARDLDALARFAETLRRERVARGAVELSSAELRFETSADAGVGDDSKDSQEVVSRKKEVFMMRVVAELMIAANAAVATELAKAQTRGLGPALLRKHDPPPPEKFEELRVALRENAGTELDASSGKALSMSLDLAESRASDPNAGAMFRSLATRAMSEAQYAELVGTVSEPRLGGDELGLGLGTFAHYGLALPLYTHFTSPIRRYADLAVHRQLWRALQSRSVDVQNGKEDAFRRLELAKTAKHLNARTRAAKVAQRRSVELRLTRALCASPVTLPAVVRSVTRTGVALFVPSFHVQVFARVVGGDGVVFLPRTGREKNADERKEDDRSVFLTTRVLFDGGVKTLAFFARGKNGSGEEEERGPRLRSGARAWVRLSASGGETRAARVEAELLDASHPEARLGVAEAARRVEAMTIDDRPALEARAVTRGTMGAVGDVTEEEGDASPARGDEKKASLGGVPAAVAATFASLLGDGDARCRAPGDTRRFGVSGSGEASRTVSARETSSAFRLARSAFVAARAAAAAEAMAAAGTRFGGGEDGETRRARRKRRAAAADLRADALRRAMEAARED